MPQIFIIYDEMNMVSFKNEDIERCKIKMAQLSITKDAVPRDIANTASRLAELLLEQIEAGE